jgi:beta-lactamase class A
VTDFPGVPGRISVWFGALDAASPWYGRFVDEPHYPASLMKVPLLVAAHRAHEEGALDLDAPVPVRNRFPSALPGAPDFALPDAPENDPSVWRLLGDSASPRWLVERMIVASSNLAANIVLGCVGADRVAEVWRLAGAVGSATPRGVEDRAARDGGVDNTVTAADLARLLSALGTGRLAGPEATRRMLDTLAAQERREDLAAGLPAGTRVAFKNGWVDGVRHAAGIVYPSDTEPYVLVVCATTPLAGTVGPDGRDGACRLVAEVASWTWERRGAGNGDRGGHLPPAPTMPE